MVRRYVHEHLHPSSIPTLLTTLRLQDCQYWLAYLGMQCRLHELRHKRRISVAAASKILANLVYSYKGMGLSMGTMCAGVTPEEGPALYYIDSDGTRLPGNLFCVGSGQTFAYGVLDAEYHYDLEDDEALELGKRSILAATHRDAFSGGYIRISAKRSTITGGYDIRIPITILFITLVDMLPLSLSPMAARVMKGNAKDGTIEAKRKQEVRFPI